MAVSAPPRLQIRPLEPADLQVLFTHANRHWGARWLERQAADEVHVAVAVVDGLPVGRVGLDLVRRAPDASFVWAAHVEHDWQSRGVGTALMRRLEEVTRERGLRAIELYVGKDNPRAQALYERLGYRVVGETTTRWSYRDERGQEVVESEDVWWMRKRLI